MLPGCPEAALAGTQASPLFEPMFSPAIPHLPMLSYRQRGSATLAALHLYLRIESLALGHHFLVS
jgi:hypothetical protein